MSATFEVVFVCTGNRFRSPIASAVFRRATEDLPVGVASLGTLDLGAVPPLPKALALAPALGIDLDDHRARALALGAAVGADLVLGFEYAHVAAAVLEGGGARERAFTLPELVELLDAAEVPGGTDPVERARKAVALAHQRRAAAGPSAPPEVRDPLGGPEELYARTAETVSAQARRLAALLFG